MLRRFLRPCGGQSVRLQSTAVQVSLEPGDFATHRLDRQPEAVAWTSKGELLDYYKLMCTMRRLEMASFAAYQKRQVRGFLHLYDGQEAVATGIQHALTNDDSWITSYRCHCIMLARGGTPEGILAELMGNETGHMGGKGGSMHFYNKAQNYYGGQGIVGAQVPVGTGLAFANKYKTAPGATMPVAISCHGDGAANQGQIAEASNMAMLWKLPMIFGIENNHYGMGTSTKRSSSNPDYYTMGNLIPGIRVNGQNVLAVREATKLAKEHAAAGRGPIYLEFSTYRFNGHSASDAGLTYRQREEVKRMRTLFDPLKITKDIALNNAIASEDELEAIRLQARADVEAAWERAKAAQPPAQAELLTNIYLDDDGKDEPPSYIRMPFSGDSVSAAEQQ